MGFIAVGPVWSVFEAVKTAWQQDVMNYSGEMRATNILRQVGTTNRGIKELYILKTAV